MSAGEPCHHEDTKNTKKQAVAVMWRLFHFPVAEVGAVVAGLIAI